MPPQIECKAVGNTAHCTNRHVYSSNVNLQLCAIHFHAVSKDIYFVLFSYYSPKKTTENLLTIVILRKTRGQLRFRSILGERASKWWNISINKLILPEELHETYVCIISVRFIHAQ